MFEEITNDAGEVIGWKLNGIDFWIIRKWDIRVDYGLMIQYAGMANVMGHGIAQALKQKGM